tara:strand:+ start:218 stop:433 length:216 start_codon:yes stop_codon:yes gene_type:complete
MKLVDAKTTQSADLGSTFISHKQVTIDLNGEDLKNLYSLKLSSKDMTLAQFFVLSDLLGHILEGVSNYDLV